MAFPNDLADVAAFKIHPAIGCARLASNEDFYEFFDYEEKRNAGLGQSLKYMSLRDGKHWIMRQAVRFRIFAYRSDGREIGELTADVMSQLGLGATWTASVANRKLNVWSNGATPAIEAQASATAGETKRLEGNNPWRPSKVWLGEITGDGLFIPPMGGVYRKTANNAIPPYGAHRSDNGVLDTTSDGSISVTLTGADNIPVVPACVIVAPQDHSPDVGPWQINNSQNKDFVRETRELLQIPQNAALAGIGYGMDIAMMQTINADYNPGMEICLDGDVALPDPAGAFYPRGQQHIDTNEIRPNYASAKPGQLTAGLCSAWQTDLNACLNYWTSTFPNEVAFDAAPDTRFLARRQFAAAGPRNSDPEWLNAHIDMMEIGRDVENDPTFVHGTERVGNDNASATPVAPFPLEAVKLPPETS
jgi:hypothetical protein